MRSSSASFRRCRGSASASGHAGCAFLDGLEAVHARLGDDVGRRVLGVEERSRRAARRLGGAGAGAGRGSAGSCGCGSSSSDSVSPKFIVVVTRRWRERCAALARARRTAGVQSVAVPLLERTHSADPDVRMGLFSFRTFARGSGRKRRRPKLSLLVCHRPLAKIWVAAIYAYRAQIAVGRILTAFVS